MHRCTLDEIVRTSNRLPFTEGHIQSLLTTVKKQNEKGLLVRLHPQFTASPEEAIEGMRDGIFVLTCPQIQSDFVFTCESAGKGLFGGQKRAFKVFIGDLEQDDFSAATSFKSFAIAITSINNIFRSEGLVSGVI